MSLREEVAILRLLLERRLNFSRTEADLLGSANAVGDLVSKIERVVASCARLEATTLLERPALLRLVDRLLDVIGRYVDGDTLDRIASAIIEAMRPVEAAS